MIKACNSKHANSKKSDAHRKGYPAKSNEKNKKARQVEKYERNHSHPINLLARRNGGILFF
jgi:hypothetical protein